MDGNTTRINRILRRSIRLPILSIRNHRPIHSSRPHQAHYNRQAMRLRDTTGMGQCRPFLRVSSSLSRIWAHHWAMVRAWNTSISMRLSRLSHCHNCARNAYSNCAKIA